MARPVVILPKWYPTLGEAPTTGDLTWAYPWPAGERMAADLSAILACQDQRISEIGCGRGRCGLTALALGARSVAFCDLAPEPLVYIETALAANQFTTGRTWKHAWGAPIPEGPYAVILGADILYRPEFHQAILTSVATSLTPDGVALLADPRPELEPELVNLATLMDLSMVFERRPGPYTLVTVRRLNLR